MAVGKILLVLRNTKVSSKKAGKSSILLIQRGRSSRDKAKLQDFGGGDYCDCCYGGKTNLIYWLPDLSLGFPKMPPQLEL